MQTDFYFPAPVQVVKVTSQNLEEVAEWCGGSIQETPSRRDKTKMDKYVLVPTPADNKMAWAFPGMFITKRLVVTVKNELKETYAVFRRDYFEKNYFETPQSATDRTWERQYAEKQKKSKKKPKVTVVSNVGQALLEAQKALTEARDLALRVGMPESRVDEILIAGNEDAANRIINIIPEGEVPTHTGETIPVENLRGLTEADVEKAVNG